MPVLPATTHNGDTVTFSALARNDKPLEGPPTEAVTATLQSNVFSLELVSGGTGITGTWETTWTVSGLNAGDYRVTFTGVATDDTEGHGESTLRVKDVPAAPQFTNPGTAITQSTSTLNVGGYAEAFSMLRLYADGVLQTTLPLSAIGEWQMPITLADGTHVITATATDGLGQVSPPGAAELVTIDTVSPTVSLEELAPYQDQITVTLRWEGSDAGTGVSDYDVGHQYGVGSDWQTLGYNTVLTEWVYVAAGQEGTHNFRVHAYDGAHNVSPWAETGTIVDVTRPELSLALAGTPPFGYALTGTLCYAGGQSGVLTATALLTDPTSGLAQVAFPDTTDYGTTYGLSGAITGTRSRGYDFDAGDTFSATVSITAATGCAEPR